MHTFTVHRDKNDTSKLLFVVRILGCFNGYNTQSAFTTLHSFHMAFQVTKEGKGKAFHYTATDRFDHEMLKNVSAMELLGVGWLSPEVLNQSANSSNCIYLRESFPAIGRDTITANLWDPYGPHQARSSNRVFTEKEKVFRDFFQYDQSFGLMSSGYKVPPSVHWEGEEDGKMCRTALGRMITLFANGKSVPGFEMVGADRPAGFCIAYLMSYRNVLSKIVINDQDSCIESAVRVAIVEELQDIPKINTFFALSIIAHHGSDNEIFTHAGWKSTAIGAVHGAWVLEKFYDEPTLEKANRYCKGSQSTNLQTRMSEKARDIFITMEDKAKQLSLTRISSDRGGILTSPFGTWDYYGVSRKLVKGQTKEFKANPSRIVEFIDYCRKVSSVVPPLDKLFKPSEADKEQLAKKSIPFTKWVETSQLEVRPVGFAAIDDNEV